LSWKRSREVDIVYSVCSSALFVGTRVSRRKVRSNRIDKLDPIGGDADSLRDETRLIDLAAFRRVLVRETVIWVSF